MSHASRIEPEHVVQVVLGCCQLVHRRMGGAVSRAVYLEAVVAELSRRRIPFRRGVKLPVFDRGVRLDAHHRVELCVSGRVILDILSVKRVQAVHRMALSRRLHLTGVPFGILMTFQSARLVLGRVIIRHGDALCLSGLVAIPGAPHGLPLEPSC